MKYSLKISNTIIQGKHLSLQVKGLYLIIAYFLSIPNFDFSQKNIFANCKNGRISIASAIAELKEQKLLHIQKTINKDGTYKYIYILLSEPSEEIPNYTKSTYVPPTSNFTFMPNAIITNKKISIAAKAVYCLFKRFASNGSDVVHISLSYLISLSKNGKHCFDSAFKELKLQSLITAFQIRSNMGFYYEYKLSIIGKATKSIINRITRIIKPIMANNFAVDKEKFSSKVKQANNLCASAYTSFLHKIQKSKNLNIHLSLENLFISTSASTLLTDRKTFNINKEEITYSMLVKAFNVLTIYDLIQIETDLISKNINIFLKERPHAYLRTCIYNKYKQVQSNINMILV